MSRSPKLTQMGNWLTCKISLKELPCKSARQMDKHRSLYFYVYSHACQNIHTCIPIYHIKHHKQEVWRPCIQASGSTDDQSRKCPACCQALGWRLAQSPAAVPSPASRTRPWTSLLWKRHKTFLKWILFFHLHALCDCNEQPWNSGVTMSWNVFCKGGQTRMTPPTPFSLFPFWCSVFCF